MGQNEIGIKNDPKSAPMKGRNIMKSVTKKILVPVLTIMIVAAATVGGFLLGCDCTIKSAVYVGPGTLYETGEPGYIISYRYGGYWSNHFYSVE